MNNTQLQTTLAPAVAFLAGMLAAKFAFFDLATWSAIITGVFGLGAVIWGGIATRKASLQNTVGNMPGTTVVTTPADAAALPANNSVVSSTEVKVVAK